MPVQMMSTSVRHRNVELGDGVVIEDFVVLGAPARGHVPGETPLRIGRDSLIRSHTVIYAGNMIGDRFQTGHGVLLRESNEIGSDVSIGSHTIVEHHVRIGDGARIHSNAFIPEFSVLEPGSWIGPNVVLTNAAYPLSPGAKSDLRGPTIRAGAKVGANATVLPGVVIGRDALVGAGAVVVHDVPDEAVVVGNPARVIGKVGDIEAYRQGVEA
jgi:acetyltransferase-like isoleucine patch superfamily enzyme